ncbi:MAG TPA: T9SS type A sorting domain-containing protein [Parafilimonas sp.]|nr:T9SS type A sorting domain-containing protein [Parafilimonas sp.]
MKRSCFFTLMLVIAGIYSTAQNSWAIEWQKSLGGSSMDRGTAAKQTPDGGYIVAGNTSSDDGDVSSNHGKYDYWIVKLNSSVGIQWQKSLGGSGLEITYSIELTPDGGYVIAGYSDSDDGDVSGNHGDFDMWIVKLDSAGIIQWQKSLGGSSYDGGSSIALTSDGGYIVAGDSWSVDGDVSGNHGGRDMWIVKLNSTGTLEWQKSFGGSDYDRATWIKETSDGGYIVIGDTQSNDGDVSGNHGGSDIWIIKLNSGGSIEWQKIIGGSNHDYAGTIEQTSDGGYIVAAEPVSNDGDVRDNHGATDYWIIKLNDSGAVQWQKSLGGSDIDIARSIKQTPDDGYIIAGSTYSFDGDVSGNHGLADYTDYWIVRLDSNGDFQWQYCLGGSSFDNAFSLEQTADGGYIVAGESGSTNGDVTDYHGGGDFWIIKLKPDAILPVTALVLNGKAQGKQNVLHWSTVTEQNNAGFEVQRSNDGYNFNKVAFVNTKAVSGNSNFKLSYDFLDIASAASTNYYRLKQIDKDNTYVYSNIVLIRGENILTAEDVTIYPNPAKNILNAKISLTRDNNVKLSVTDMSGKTIISKSTLAAKGENIIQLDISHLSSGSYIVKAVFENGRTAEKKFIKEH